MKRSNLVRGREEKKMICEMRKEEEERGTANECRRDYKKSLPLKGRLLI